MEVNSQKNILGAPAWRVALWLFFLASWTFLLLMPIEQKPQWPVEGLGIDVAFISGKTLHIAANAFMAIFGAWLGISSRYRWLVMYVLLAHGPLTEFLQPLTGRTGELRDVILDHLGVSIGILLSFPWWIAPDQIRGESG